MDRDEIVRDIVRYAVYADEEARGRAMDAMSSMELHEVLDVFRDVDKGVRNELDLKWSKIVNKIGEGAR